MTNSFYTNDELHELGLKKIGSNVKISRNAQFYGNENIAIGNNVRIDDYCILSGNIILENNIHIAAFCALYGSGGIIMRNYTGLSPRSTLLSASDDFSGDFFVGPQYVDYMVNVKKGLIEFNKYCQLGSGSIVLPGVEFGEGSVTGAMTLINKNTEKWKIYLGIPGKILKKRSKKMLELINE